MEKYLTPRSLIAASLLICTGYFIYLVGITDFLYLQDDAYYYGALADGMATQGQWSNLVTAPPGNLRTPQNAIILLHSLMYGLGVHDLNTRLILLSALNSLLICLIGYWSFLLFKRIGLQDAVAWLLAVSIPLAYYYQMVWLMPINDTAFVALALAVLLITPTTDTPYSRRLTILLLVLAGSISFFRLAGALLFLAYLPVFLRQRLTGRAAGFFALSVISAASPVVLNKLLGFNMANLESRSGEILSGLDLGYFVDHLVKTVTLSVPEALLRLTHFTAGFTIPHPALGTLISLVLIVLLALMVRHAWAERNAALLVLIGWIVLNLAFFQIHPAQPTRYLMAASILLPLPLFLNRWRTWHRHIAGVFILAITLISAAGMAASPNREIGNSKRLYATQIRNFLANQDSVQVLSYFPRVSYFLLRRSAARSLEDALAARPRHLLLFGPGWYAGEIMEQMQKQGIQIGVEKLPLSYHDYTVSLADRFGEHVELTEIMSHWITLPDGADHE